MTEVKAGHEYKIILDGKTFLLDEKKFKFLNYINLAGSISEASKKVGISYRTALNYIEKLETSLDIAVVSTNKGGKGGGGSTTLTSEGQLILKECKKINAIMELHKELNELEATVSKINKHKGIMEIKIDEIKVTIPLKEDYNIGDQILALISYDNIFLMLEPQKSSIRNVFKGIITEMCLNKEMIRVKVDINGIDIYADITVSASKELKLTLAKEIYIGFKAVAIATMKL